ncbi:uncharacterized protein LOC133732382 [Rosa rugosa]|uniref:uncharacterized protein LOC133732382 n=1 Tax=Rosa rugosa TaxID=74645 RepID=UPI002B40D4B1|nr:uncharacterized protein LOC133732382 [Rosa rugosa]
MAMVKNERDCSGAIDHFRLYSNLGTAFRRSCLSWYVGCVGHDFPIVFYLALGGSLLSYIYSAPPLKLKKRGHLLLKPRHWILISRYTRALQNLQRYQNKGSFCLYYWILVAGSWQ